MKIRSVCVLFLLLACSALAAVPPSPRPAVFVLVSFSMPKASLDGWLREAQALGAEVAVRGLVDGSFSKTLACVRALSQRTGAGLAIDPVAFRDFGIKAVPAVVVAVPQPPCLPHRPCAPPIFSVVYGDVHLQYALTRLAQGGDTRVQRLAQVALHGLTHGGPPHAN